MVIVNLWNRRAKKIPSDWLKVARDIRRYYELKPLAQGGPKLTDLKHSKNYLSNRIRGFYGDSGGMPDMQELAEKVITTRLVLLTELAIQGGEA